MVWMARVQLLVRAMQFSSSPDPENLKDPPSNLSNMYWHSYPVTKEARR
jgi:hypothetical protein